MQEGALAFARSAPEYSASGKVREGGAGSSRGGGSAGLGAKRSRSGGNGEGGLRGQPSCVVRASQWMSLAREAVDLLGLEAQSERGVSCLEVAAAAMGAGVVRSSGRVSALAAALVLGLRRKGGLLGKRAHADVRRLADASSSSGGAPRAPPGRSGRHCAGAAPESHVITLKAAALAAALAMQAHSPDSAGQGVQSQDKSTKRRRVGEGKARAASSSLDGQHAKGPIQAPQPGQVQRAARRLRAAVPELHSDRGLLASRARAGGTMSFSLASRLGLHRSVAELARTVEERMREAAIPVPSHAREAGKPAAGTIGVGTAGTAQDGKRITNVLRVVDGEPAPVVAAAATWLAAALAARELGLQKVLDSSSSRANHGNSATSDVTNRSNGQAGRGRGRKAAAGTIQPVLRTAQWWLHDRIGSELLLRIRDAMELEGGGSRLGPASASPVAAGSQQSRRDAWQLCGSSACCSELQLGELVRLAGVQEDEVKSLLRRAAKTHASAAKQGLAEPKGFLGLSASALRARLGLLAGLHALGPEAARTAVQAAFVPAGGLAPGPVSKLLRELGGESSSSSSSSASSFS